jgi:hypothetical protein
VGVGVPSVTRAQFPLCLGLYKLHSTFQVLMMVNNKIAVVRKVTPCGLVEGKKTPQIFELQDHQSKSKANPVTGRGGQ